jgi:TRAP-type mannitol/chloroaromatic compound transport system permease large subunit
MDGDHRDLRADLLPLLKHFNIDPILWGTLVFVNLQARSVAAGGVTVFYLKGVSPPMSL